MTADQLAHLTDEEKRVKLAEFCGWTEVRKEFVHFDGWMTLGKREGAEQVDEVPDYLNSLDAISEVEQKLSNDQHAAFGNVLQQMIYDQLKSTLCEGSYHYHPVTRAFISATARQRADAILMIL